MIGTEGADLATTSSLLADGIVASELAADYGYVDQSLIQHGAGVMSPIEIGGNFEAKVDSKADSKYEAESNDSDSKAADLDLAASPVDDAVGRPAQVVTRQAIRAPRPTCRATGLGSNRRSSTE